MWEKVISGIPANVCEGAILFTAKEQWNYSPVISTTYQQWKVELKWETIPDTIPNRFTSEESWSAKISPISFTSGSISCVGSMVSTTVKCWHIQCLGGLNFKEMGFMVWWCAHRRISPNDQPRYRAIAFDSMWPACNEPANSVSAISNSAVELHPFIRNCFHVFWMFKYQCCCGGE